MTYVQSLGMALFGLLLIVSGLVWLFGPYGLIGAGVLVFVAALLAPEKERRGEEPVGPDPSPPA